MKSARTRERWIAVSAVLAVAVAGPGCVDPTGRVRTADNTNPYGAPTPPPGQPARDWGPTVHQAEAPPPISGGTLLVAEGGRVAVAADPDRDRIYVVDLERRAVTRELELNHGDEPGRVVEGPPGTVHVALRRGGALVTVDLASLAITQRRPVCAAPRGVAYDPRTQSVHVACSGGELVTLPAAGGDATRTVMLERDLRDVVVSGDQLMVSRFRSADLLVVDQAGSVTGRTHPPSVTRGTQSLASTVAWRTVALAGGGVAMLHQREQTTEVTGAPQGYYGAPPCVPGIVEGAVTTIAGTAQPGVTPPVVGAVLPVDVAFNAAGTEFAVVAPGNAGMTTANQLFVYNNQSYRAAGAGPTTGTCDGNGAAGSYQFLGQQTAVAYAADDRIVLQSREPATLTVLTPRGQPAAASRSYDSVQVRLSDVSRADTGHAVFHGNSGRAIACAGCHPEGGDDGHVWRFQDIGTRRTQELRGGIRGTEPFHWEGELRTFAELMHDTFTTRMSGGTLNTAQTQALGDWIETVPRLPTLAARDVTAVDRGRALFNDATVGCAGCHSGDRMSDNRTVNVGTGAAFQVPSLRGVAMRAPFMHDGCAATLMDRFGACGGGEEHGHTQQLNTAQRADLVAYLETL